MLLCQPNNNERLTSLTSSFNYNFRMWCQHPPQASDCSGKPAARFFSGWGFAAESTVPQQDCASEENCDAACPQNIIENNEIFFMQKLQYSFVFLVFSLFSFAQNNVVNIIAHNHGIPPSKVELNHFRDSYMPFSRSEEVRQ